MEISPARAKQLCTQREFEFVEPSWGKPLERMDASELRDRVRQARVYRDKYRDLAKQQAGEARGKRDPRSTRPAESNENTRLKAQLFDEALERFRARAETAEG